MKSSRIYSTAVVIISVGLVPFFAYYLYLNKDNFLHLLHISAPSVFTLVLITITFNL